VTGQAGIEVCRGTVQPAWIDFNQHMNVAYYVLAFDQGIDALWDTFGITQEYVSSEQGSTFAVECHVTYQQELHEGDPYIITTQVLGYDAKRIHQFQRLYHARDGFLSATCEWMNLHVDLGSRRVSPWPAEILARIEAFASVQHSQPRPDEAGRIMSIRNPIYSL
jgi:acyl-CoA thioester hydrolase